MLDFLYRDIKLKSGAYVGIDVIGYKQMEVINFRLKNRSSRF